MGRRGPPKTSQPEAKQKGSRRGDKPSEHVATGRRPEPPDWLSDAALDIWCEVVEPLVEAKIVGQLDSHVLGRYCDLLAERIALRKQLGDSLTYTTSAGVEVCRPELGRINSIDIQLMKIERELGKTAASRPAVKPEQSVGEEDPLTKVLNARAAG